MHLMMSTGAARGTSLDLVNILKNFLRDNSIQVVATTSIRPSWLRSAAARPRTSGDWPAEVVSATAPWTGAPMFRVRAHVVVPQGVVVAELRHELEREFSAFPQLGQARAQVGAIVEIILHGIDVDGWVAIIIGVLWQPKQG